LGPRPISEEQAPRGIFGVTPIRYPRRGRKINCSLATAYTLIAAAIVALGAAIALAAIFFNIPGLVVAIALVLTVSFYLIPSIRKELTTYEQCRGPSTRCSMASNINLLGQAAMLISVLAWGAALVGYIACLAALLSWFLAWLCGILVPAAESLKWAGIFANGAAILILIGLRTNVANYEACRDEEDGSGGNGGGPIG
jgi:hypothetical protein